MYNVVKLKITKICDRREVVSGLVASGFKVWIEAGPTPAPSRNEKSFVCFEAHPDQCFVEEIRT